MAWDRATPESFSKHEDDDSKENVKNRSETTSNALFEKEILSSRT